MTEVMNEEVVIPLPDYFILPSQVAINILNYLVRQPYGEVVDLADSLRALQPLNLEELSN